MGRRMGRMSGGNVGIFLALHVRMGIEGRVTMDNDNREAVVSQSMRVNDIGTRWWALDGLSTEARGMAIKEAAALIASGQTVAFPTETVYGLGGDATSSDAVERIFTAKGRPSDNPLIVHVASITQVDELVMPYGDIASKLMERYWPGPLTIVLPVRRGKVSERVTAGLNTVAVRMPDHSVALELILAAGCPIAAPSANRSGRPSPTRAEHVRADLDGRIAGIVDGGETGVGVESTVVEVRDGEIQVLRPGGITPEMLAEVCSRVTIDPAVDPEHGMRQEPQMKLESNSVDANTNAEVGVTVTVDTAAAEAPRSPGMKYTHYAPQGVMMLVQGNSVDRVTAYIQADLEDAKRRGEMTGVLAFSENAGRYSADVVAELGSLADLSQAAQRLYGALRQFDDAGATYILAEVCPAEGIGLAVMNRLMKAAGHRLILI